MQNTFLVHLFLKGKLPKSFEIFFKNQAMSTLTPHVSAGMNVYTYLALKVSLTE